MTKEKNILERYRKKGLTNKKSIKLSNFSDGDWAKFVRYAERRCFGEPIAYIQGWADFYARRFKVDRRVYIPDKKTEYLVQTALEEISNNSIILDIGTGCGCIAITLKMENPHLGRLRKIELNGN